MMKTFERTISWRYLFSSRRETIISVIGGFSLAGIALGVAALIVVMSVMNGFRTELLRSLLHFNGHMELYSAGKQGFNPTTPLLTRLSADTRIASITPLIAGEAMLTTQKRAKGMLIRGLDFAKSQQFPFLKTATITAGTLPQQPGDLLLGQGAQTRLGVTVGDVVKLIAPEGNETPFGIVPRVRAFRVCGFFQVGMTEYENNVAFLSLIDAQQFYRLEGQVNQAEVFLHDPESAQFLAQSYRPHVQAPLYLAPWQETQGPLATALTVERNAMFVILTLIILVAAFNITSSLVMLVKDKSKDIAILRTMGATHQQIMRLFFNVGFSLSLMGIGAGFALGIPFALNIENIRRWLEGLFHTPLFDAQVYFLSQLPCELRFQDLGIIGGMALFLGMGASLYPAWRAARLNPVEGLHYES